MNKIVMAMFLLVSATAYAAQPTVGPLHSIKLDQFMQLPEKFQALYVAGAIDGMTFTTYGYAIPDHDALVSCYRSRPLGEFTKQVVETAKLHPEFKENVATLVAMTAGRLCPH